jgi:uncharacterized protein (DUF1810 family)
MVDISSADVVGNNIHACAQSLGFRFRRSGSKVFENAAARKAVESTHFFVVTS